MSAQEAMFLATTLLGLGLLAVYAGCAFAVEFWLERAHEASTGVDLVSPWPALPLRAQEKGPASREAPGFVGPAARAAAHASARRLSSTARMCGSSSLLMW